MGKENGGLVISIPKCAVIMTDGSDMHTYILDDKPLPTVDSHKDLGVVIGTLLKFRMHFTLTASSASKLCSLILRAFIIRDSQVYLKA